MARLMFETFKAPAVCICNSAVLSLFASGRTRGVVLESGSGVTSAVPIFEGFSLPHATLRENLAGQDVTQHLQGTLAAQGHTDLDLDIVRDIKEKLAVVNCPGTAQAQAGSSEYELPDGTDAPHPLSLPLSPKKKKKKKKKFNPHCSQKHPQQIGATTPISTFTHPPPPALSLSLCLSSHSAMRGSTNQCRSPTPTRILIVTLIFNHNPNPKPNPNPRLDDHDRLLM